MDTNSTRQNRKDQKLTYNQFVRSMSKLDFSLSKPRVFDINIILDLTTILIGVHDLRQVVIHNKEKAKYPMAILLFGLLRLFINQGSKLPKYKKLPASRLLAYSSYGAITEITENINFLLLVFQGYILNIETVSKQDLFEVLTSIYFNIRNLMDYFSIQFDNVLYLAIEFYKDIPYFQEGKDPRIAFKRLEKIRFNYLKVDVEVPKSYIQQYLQKQWEQFTKRGKS